MRFNVETGSWFSKKTKILCLHPDKIQVLTSAGQKKNIFSKQYQELQAITKSLMQGQRNFVAHFRGTVDEEWNAEHRDTLIKAIADRYSASEGKQLQVFGVSSKTLEAHCANEKDVKKQVSKIPPTQFLLKSNNFDGNLSAS